MSQHTDEPSVDATSDDEARRWADKVLEVAVEQPDRAEKWASTRRIAEWVRSRLSHPTLSADRNAVIEECAKVADAAGGTCDYVSEMQARYIAHNIRALKQ